MTCPQGATDAGAYVLDALEPAERAGFDAHLTGCAACRTEVDELSGLPPLLARLDAEEAAGSPVRPPADLYDRVRAAVADDVGPRRSRPRRLLLAAAALALAVAGAVVGVVPWSGSASAPVLHTVTAGDTRVTVAVTGDDDGTGLDVVVAGLPGGTECRLFVVDGADDWHATGEWAADPAGRARFRAWTPVARDELTGAVLLDASGGELVRVPL
ncbi:anti-sigma factor [Blastococcus sp. URHD0036]|uniref:anti-sigma factor family protein n=1 Tax=Blastococcus sp. URHD0036 TaxID=1380356 RepID=UPI00068E884A|nr:zf-HC2 domain-containing protein [Blastococcus sp. URHD0036]